MNQQPTEKQIRDTYDDYDRFSTLTGCAGWQEVTQRAGRRG